MNPIYILPSFQRNLIETLLKQLKQLKNGSEYNNNNKMDFDCYYYCCYCSVFTVFSDRKIRCNQCWFVRHVKTSNWNKTPIKRKSDDNLMLYWDRQWADIPFFLLLSIGGPVLDAFCFCFCLLAFFHSLFFRKSRGRKNWCLNA